MAKIAIATVSWGEPEITKKCVESIYSTTSSQFHFFWTQNEFKNKRDGMEEIELWLDENHNNSTIIYREDNPNWPGGINSCLELILEDESFDYIAMMNNDIVLYDGWDTSMINCFKSDHDLPPIGALSTLIDNGNFQEVDNMSQSYPDVVPKQAKDEPLEDYARRIIGNKNKPITVFDLSFSFVLLPFDVVKKIGLVDERFHAGYGVDTDYSTSIKHAGFRLCVDPNVVVHHDHGGSSKHTIVDRSNYGKEAMDMLIDKWRDKGYW